ncbi:unnamed protein product, partial [Ectocarpus sp. 12 AP-2014]
IVTLQTQHRSLAEEADVLRQRCDELEKTVRRLEPDHGEDGRGKGGRRGSSGDVPSVNRMDHTILHGMDAKGALSLCGLPDHQCLQGLYNSINAHGAADN